LGHHILSVNMKDMNDPSAKTGIN